MTIFLTSSHTMGWAGPLNPANGLIDRLRRELKRPIRCVMVSSFPDDLEITDRMAWETRETFEWAHLAFSHFEVLDRRTQRYARRMISHANLIILCGGHVPTENAFFKQIKLKQLLEGYDGVLLTISAGSMNCATTVYSAPELEGEALDESYQLHFPGLGLTDINILPHYQQLRHARVDGLKLRNLVASHSYEHPIYCIPDGTYFFITPEATFICGKAYKMKDGKLTRICSEGEVKKMTGGGRFYKVNNPT